MIEQLKNPYKWALEFELVIKEILEYNNFKNVKHNVRLSKNIIDISANFENKKYIFEIKIYRNNYRNYEIIKLASLKLKNICRSLEKITTNEKEILPILILGSTLPKNKKEQLENLNDISIWDLKNLLYLVDDNKILKQRLISLLDFSVGDIEIERTKNFNKKENNEKEQTEKTDKGQELIEKLGMEHKKWRTYENLCCDVLEYLFDDELSNKKYWKKQKISSGGMNRYDMICPIKTGRIKPYFWEIIEQHFNSKFILFEFKNYKKSISQGQIYLTAKYLYLKALRGVAIIISNKKLDEKKEKDRNTQKAAEGILREEGKLIMNICNEDLIEMIKLKKDNEVPSDYLANKLDEILIKIEK